MSGAGSFKAFCTLARNQASCSAVLFWRAKGSSPSFAVRVSTMRTTSERVRPMPARTAAALSFTLGSMRVCTNAFAAIVSSHHSISQGSSTVFHSHHKSMDEYLYDKDAIEVRSLDNYWKEKEWLDRSYLMSRQFWPM